MIYYLFTSNDEQHRHYLYDDVEGYIIYYTSRNLNTYKWKWSNNLEIYGSNPSTVVMEFNLPEKLVIGPPIPNFNDLFYALSSSIEQLIFDKL